MDIPNWVEYTAELNPEDNAQGYGTLFLSKDLFLIDGYADNKILKNEWPIKIWKESGWVFKKVVWNLENI